MATPDNSTHDVVIVGAGAAGLTAAIVAAHAGLRPIVLEKAPVFGGTTAFSGGVLWIPGNSHARRNGIADSSDAARTYLRHEAGNRYREDVTDMFLRHGPEMLDYLEAHSEVRFQPSEYPDYHPEAPGGVQRGRSVTTAPFDGRRLGRDLHRLRPPLRSITFLGMMFNSANTDLKHFYNVTRSLKSAGYVAKRLAVHMAHLLRHRRGVQLTSGNALAARLARSVLDLGIEIVTGADVRELIVEHGAVTGVIASIDGRDRTFRAGRAVILASGGFARDGARVAERYAHLGPGTPHLSPVPDSVTGDGIDMAERAGAAFAGDYPNAAAWMPVSRVPGPTPLAFPHLVDRYKPGFIMVGAAGRRFVNESHSYHDVGAAMQAARGAADTARAWLIADHRAVRKYGIGFAKPAPMPIQLYLRSGYLVRADSIAGLAQRIGVDADALQATIASFNAGAAHGEDAAFGRGSTGFNRYLGDAEHQPNPNVAPIVKGPFYAVELRIGDLGTFEGLSTDRYGRVLRADGSPIDGLYAVGNDMASMMGGAYPGAGITLGPAMTFGYVAARHIAGDLPGEPVAA